MKRILTTFCFDHDSLSNTVIAEIIEKTVFFSPTSIQSNVFLNLGGKYRGNFHIDKIRDSMDPIKSLDLTTELGLKGPSFHVGYIANWKMKMVYWKLPQQSNIKDELLHELTDAKGFNIGYQTDSEYSFWQSADSMNTYEVKNRSYDHLPIIKHPVTGRLMVDISNNPGRRSLFPGMWLQVAQKMWFGNGSFTYFDKKEIMEYRNADSIIELENGTVFVDSMMILLQVRKRSIKRNKLSLGSFLELILWREMHMK
jgi:hypothetical protein